LRTRDLAARDAERAIRYPDRSAVFEAKAIRERSSVCFRDVVLTSVALRAHREGVLLIPERTRSL
jgi:hypothetical protein